MSTKSNQQQTPPLGDSNQGDNNLNQGEGQDQATAKTGAGTEAQSSPSGPSEEEIQTRIDAAVEKALAKRDEQLAAQKAEEKAKAQEVTTVDEDSNFPFGNKDFDKEFDITKLLPGLTEFPKDKVTIVIQTFYQAPSQQGTNELSEDKAMRRIQFIDPLDFAAGIKVDPNTGRSPYELMGLNYTVLNEPVSQK